VRALPAGAPAPLGCPRFEGQRLGADRLCHGKDVFTLPVPLGPGDGPVAFTLLGATVLPPRRRDAVA
jgi:hypothetical protein